MYAISESAEFNGYSLLESEKGQEGSWSVRFEAVVQQLDFVNKNGRKYSTQLMDRGIKSIAQKIANREIVGEFGHPISEVAAASNPQEAMKRSTTIDPVKIAVLFEKIWIDGNVIKAQVKTLNNDHGRNLANMIVYDKIGIGFSLRAVGNFKQEGGVNVVEDDGKFTVITYDVVVNPSNPKAMFFSQSDKYSMAESSLYSDVESLTESTNDYMKSHQHEINDSYCVGGNCDINFVCESMQFNHKNKEFGVNQITKNLVKEQFKKSLENIKNNL